jgi:hypothetical protein
MQEEIWKDIPNYEGRYMVSSNGKVKRLYREKDKILKVHLSVKGYYCISLYKDKTAKNYKVHQLVAMAFLSHKPNGLNMVVDHINNVKTDNRLNNLQLITIRENSSKDKNGTSKYTGVWKNGNKWCAAIVLNKRKKYLGVFINELDAHIAYQTELNKSEHK